MFKKGILNISHLKIICKWGLKVKTKYVTPFQYQILNLCKDEFLTVSIIAKELNRKPNTVAFTIKRMQEIGYIFQQKNEYKSANFDFYECKEVSSANMRKKQDSIKVEIKDELKAYIPNEQTKINVLKLHEAGLKRKEICKALKMKPTEVLWTLIWTKDDTKSIEKENFIELDDIEESIYYFIRNKNITIEQIMKKTKLTYVELQFYLNELKRKGAIIIKNNKTHTEYIALDIEIKKNNVKEEEYEIEVRADDCKRNCTCKSDNRKCGF